MAAVVALDTAWGISPQVALRPESFGAVAYHFGNRRLTFLKHPSLVAAVRELAKCDCVDDALDAAGVPGEQRTAYLAALQNLADGDMIRPRGEAGAA